MNLKATAQRLCLLLSWLEILGRTPHSEAFAGRHYRRFVNQAIADLRAEASAAIVEVGERLQQRIAAGEAPEGLDALRHEIHQLNHLIKVQSPHELGGTVVMTLEGFADTFDAKPKSTLGFTPLERPDFIIIMVATFLIALSCFGLTWYYLWRVDVAFELERADADYFVLHVRNEGPRALSFIGSWPATSPTWDGPTFGVSVACRANDGETFQAMDANSDIWIFQNEYMSPLRKITIEPGAEISVLLDVRTLESDYGSPLNAVRLECGSSGRRRQSVFTEPVTPLSI